MMPLRWLMQSKERIYWWLIAHRSRSNRLGGVEAVAARLGARRTIVLYQFANEQWLAELERNGHSALQYPVEPSRLAFEMGRVQVEKETTEGIGNLSDLMPAKPRLFSDQELMAAAEEKIVLDCECPRHLSGLIRSLNDFEAYSSACSVENWKDAAIHASIYAYTCQARHLMEKALQSALEGRTLAVDATPCAEARLISLARASQSGEPLSCHTHRHTGASVGISSTLN